jgi:hypothetical protein
MKVLTVYVHFFLYDYLAFREVTGHPRQSSLGISEITEKDAVVAWSFAPRDVVGKRVAHQSNLCFVHWSLVVQHESR